MNRPRGEKKSVAFCACPRVWFINGEVAMPRRPVEILDIDPMPTTI